MFKSFINKYAYIAYQKIKSKINIVLFLILIVLLIGIIFSTLFGGNSEEENTVPENTSSYKPHETVVAGDDVENTNYEKEESMINTFVEYCNNGQVAEAYNMLSSDCKEVLYPTQADFEQNYYQQIFSTKKICNLQSWINENNYTVYRVRFIDDIMSTGNYEESDKYQDYITVVNEEEDKQYLNINKYVVKEDVKDAEIETDEIYIQVQSMEQYIDYVEYTFSVKNKSDKTILMDTLEDISDTMYITTKTNKKRSSNSTNLNILDLKIDPYNTEKIKIRYNKSLGTNDNDGEIHFLKIIKDYEAYVENKEHYSDVLELTIEL